MRAIVRPEEDRRWKEQDQPYQKHKGLADLDFAMARMWKTHWWLKEPPLPFESKEARKEKESQGQSSEDQEKSGGGIVFSGRGGRSKKPIFRKKEKQ